MKIKISWSASSNIKFKEEAIIDVDKEDWTSMTEDEQWEFIRDQALEESGFSYDYEGYDNENSN